MMNVILLASGYAKRFGSNKLLYPVQGVPMYRHAVETAKLFQKQYKNEPVRLFCITAYEEISRELSERDGFLPYEPFQAEQAEDCEDGRLFFENIPEQNLVVKNRNQEKGISHSIVLGVKASEKRAKTAGERDNLMFMVCDQPWLTAEELSRLAEGFRQSGKTIGCLAYGGRTGNPVLFSGIYREELLELRGDTGGKTVCRRHPEEVYLCSISNPMALMDVDQIGNVIDWEEDGELHESL